MNVEYGRTSYVSGCGAEMLDAIENSGLRIQMTGDGLVCVDYEELEDFVNDLTVTAIANSKTFTFLKDALLSIHNTSDPTDQHGDIVFVK